MSSRRAERLVNLVICLLSTRQYLPASRIRQAVPGYEPDDGSPKADEAFKRMFERDKAELRELGIPLETGANSAQDDEAGYRISRQAYMLPDIRLEPDEAAVLGLAARVWRRAELSGAAEGALLKLRAAGIEAQDTLQPGIEPRLQTGEAAFGALWQAVRDRRAVTFAYRGAGRAEAQQRRLEPWGVVNRNGRWYVVGQDIDRGEQRVFRLGRIEGPVSFTGPAGAVQVPVGADVRAAVRKWDFDSPPQRTGVLRVRAGAGSGLRRHAVRTEPGPEPGWDTIAVPYSDSDWWSGHLASFGADVIVLEPADLREAVIGHLKGVLA